MANTFDKTSFIPQKKLGGKIKRRRAPLGLLFVLSIILFLIALAGIIGVIVYEEILERSIESKAVSLQRAQDAFDPDLIDELRRLDNRIKSSQSILNAHISMTPFFALLEDLTLKNVRFNEFRFSLEDTSGITSLIMAGEAVDYATVVLQSDLMGQSKHLKGQIFSDVNLDEETGNIRFSLRTTLDPELISFTSNIDNL